jgi:hypothetical protein
MGACRTFQCTSPTCNVGNTFRAENLARSHDHLEMTPDAHSHQALSISIGNRSDAEVIGVMDDGVIEIIEINLAL